MTSLELFDPLIGQLLGPTRARKLRRFAQRTGLTPACLLRTAFDLVEIHLASAPVVKNAEAVSMGEARWKGVSPEARAKIARLAANQRWARRG